MTTLVATQRALEHLSMSNQQERRRSKRPAAAADFERDDDFQFVRKSKRSKTEEPPASKTTGRGRRTTADQAIKEPTVAAPRTAAPSQPSPATTGTRRSSRRQQVDDAPRKDEPQTERRPTRRSSRVAAAGADGDAETESSTLHDAPSKASSPDREKVSKPRRWEPSPTPRRPTESKIALPMSDTPVINRNKEMRKKAGKGNRRSSLGSRGRRASSLIENGQTATPHRDVNTAEFYKHIEAEGLLEPKRMKQLLMWCGERALPSKPPHGTPNSNAILGARAIQEQILKDFAHRTDFSNWFSRDEDAPKEAPVLKPNPRNVELDEKLKALEAKIQTLQDEKRAWLAIRQPPPPDTPPMSSWAEAPDIELPDLGLLEPEEVTIRTYLADEMAPFAAMRAKTEERIRKIQASLEFEVDQLADSVHKLEQRVLVAGRQADQVLRLSAARLKEREQREKESAGTRDMPLMEVLRSLSNVLPEGG
ncbi:Mis12-Mtw1 family protein [Metarhizium album ARSEF 1941]|uniref:Mis12-Mtw1 family protein n=1 Tax=Metarhizium album (strain ARSEF 1941) TaxID=1081103 RepID=A0A0B2WLQ4_METAS|nr:Mis12-Mtw1 family protein [Metarhizium album ARSEF 1941]KHN96991.1 Mis12-Mtw1 family protein [Metarhizium album ARSEF 1941]